MSKCKCTPNGDPLLAHVAEERQRTVGARRRVSKFNRPTIPETHFRQPTDPGDEPQPDPPGLGFREPFDPGDVPDSDPPLPGEEPLPLPEPESATGRTELDFEIFQPDPVLPSTGVLGTPTAPVPNPGSLGALPDPNRPPPVPLPDPFERAREEAFLGIFREVHAVGGLEALPGTAINTMPYRAPRLASAVGSNPASCGHLKTGQLGLETGGV